MNSVAWNRKDSPDKVRHGTLQDKPVGTRVLHVESVYDFKVYLIAGEFHAFDTRIHSDLGVFKTKTQAVKAIMAFYEANGLARAPNPGLRLLDKTYPVGHNTNLRTVH